MRRVFLPCLVELTCLHAVDNLPVSKISRSIDSNSHICQVAAMSSKGASVVFACDVGSVSFNLDAVGLAD